MNKPINLQDPPLIMDFPSDTSALPSHIQLGDQVDRYYYVGGYSTTEYSEESLSNPPKEFDLNLSDPLDLSLIKSEINTTFAQAATGKSILFINGSQVTPENFEDFAHYIDGANQHLEQYFLDIKEVDPNIYEEYKESFYGQYGDYRKQVQATDDSRGALDNNDDSTQYKSYADSPSVPAMKT